MFHATSTWMSFEWFFRSSRTNFHRKISNAHIKFKYNFRFNLHLYILWNDWWKSISAKVDWRVSQEGPKMECIRQCAIDENELAATVKRCGFMKMWLLVKVNTNSLFMANQSIHTSCVFFPEAHANITSNRFPESWFFTTFSVGVCLWFASRKFVTCNRLD